MAEKKESKEKIIEFLLGDECMWKVAVLKNPELEKEKDFKECYGCNGKNRSCLGYIPISEADKEQK